jgi:hypothetical protein
MNQETTHPKTKNILSDFLKSFFVPMLINKAFMLYFGLNYSDHPDEGYGYGLAITIVFFLFTIGKFLWAYKDVEDP